MCEFCFDEEYKEFESDITYANFYDQLIDKLAHNHMKLVVEGLNLSSIIDKEYNIKFTDVLVDNYRCNHCHEVWTLSKNAKSYH